MHDGRIALLGLVALDAAVLQDQEGAVLVLQDLAVFGEDGDAFLRDRGGRRGDAEQEAVGPALADVEGEAGLDRR